MITLFGTNLHHRYVGVCLYYLLYNHTSFIIYSLFLNTNTDFEVTLLKCFYKHISLNYMAHKSKYIKKDYIAYTGPESVHKQRLEMMAKI